MNIKTAVAAMSVLASTGAFADFSLNLDLSGKPMRDLSKTTSKAIVGYISAMHAYGDDYWFVTNKYETAAVMKKVHEMFPAPEEKKDEGKAENGGTSSTTGSAGGSPEGEGSLVHKPEVEYDDFAKLEFRVGEIIACEEVPKSRKLLCNTVRFGNETRQILSGIKAWYKPEEMVGKKVMAIVNLKPAKLAGMMSEGMILAAEDEDGNLSLMTPDRPVAGGAEVR